MGRILMNCGLFLGQVEDKVIESDINYIFRADRIKYKSEVIEKETKKLYYLYNTGKSSSCTLNGEIISTPGILMIEGEKLIDGCVEIGEQLTLKILVNDQELAKKFNLPEAIEIIVWVSDFRKLAEPDAGSKFQKGLTVLLSGATGGPNHFDLEFYSQLLYKITLTNSSFYSTLALVASLENYTVKIKGSLSGLTRASYYAKIYEAIIPTIYKYIYKEDITDGKVSIFGRSAGGQIAPELSTIKANHTVMIGPTGFCSELSPFQKLELTISFLSSFSKPYLRSDQEYEALVKRLPQQYNTRPQGQEPELHEVEGQNPSFTNSQLQDNLWLRIYETIKNNTCRIVITNLIIVFQFIKNWAHLAETMSDGNRIYSEIEGTVTLVIPTRDRVIKLVETIFECQNTETLKEIIEILDKDSEVAIKRDYLNKAHKYFQKIFPNAKEVKVVFTDTGHIMTSLNTKKDGKVLLKALEPLGK